MVSMMDQQQIPAGYKQTEVGVIPEDWGVSRISNVATVIDSLHQTPTFSATGYAMVRVADIKTGYLNLENALSVSKEVFDVFTKNYKPKKGDIVLSRVGSYGVSSYVETNEEFCMGQNTVVMQSKIPSKFLYYILNSVATWQQIEDGSYGSGYKSLSLKNINEIVIALPCLKEQTAIANALSDVDALIAALEKLIDKKTAIKTATMQQLLTGKKRLPPFDQLNAGYKQTELGEIPKDWEVVSLSAISSFITKGSTPTTYGFGWEKDGIIFLRSECVSEYGLDLSESMFISQKAHQTLKRSEVCAGDILITITGNVGRIVFLDHRVSEGNINQHIARVRINTAEVEATYIYYFLTQAFVRKNFNKITTGQAYPQISLVQVREALVCLPSHREQALISNILSDMDSELDALQQRLAKTQYIKQGMMQELLTGKTRLVTV